MWHLVVIFGSKINFSSSPHSDIEAVAEAFDDQTSEELLSLMKSPKVADCINQNRSTFYSLLGIVFSFAYLKTD